MKRTLLVLMVVAALLGLAVGGAVAEEKDYQESGAAQGFGGQLITDDGQLVFSVPASAFDVYSNISMRYFLPGASNLPEPPASTIWVGQPFRLEVRDWDSQAFTSLTKPATMTIRYRPEELGGRSESSLRIVRFFDRWVSLPSTVDTVGQTVTAQVMWGGEYGLVADNVGSPAPVVSAPAPAPVAAPPAPAAPSVPMNSGITGKVFYDKNGNGAMDGDDFPIVGATLRVSSGSWSAETTSSGDGGYAFWVLRESSYTVEVLVGPEWAHTTPSAVAGVYVNGQADSRGTANFGMWYKLP